MLHVVTQFNNYLNNSSLISTITLLFILTEKSTHPVLQGKIGISSCPHVAQVFTSPNINTPQQHVSTAFVPRRLTGPTTWPDSDIDHLHDNF